MRILLSNSASTTAVAQPTGVAARKPVRLDVLMTSVKHAFVRLHRIVVTQPSTQDGMPDAQRWLKHTVRWQGVLKDVARNVDVRSHQLEKRAVPYSPVRDVKVLREILRVVKMAIAWTVYVTSTPYVATSPGPTSVPRKPTMNVRERALVAADEPVANP